MTLSASTLASGLAAMTPTLYEASAIQAFSDAWEGYFDESTVSGIAATPDSYASALSALRSAMSGCSASGAAAASIQAALVAFWNGLSAVATSVWITAPIVLVPPVVPPPGLTGIAAALTSVFAANTSSSLSLEDAADAIASALHSANAGGTIPGSVPPAPPAPIPIL